MKIINGMIVLFLMLLTGCTSETEFGKCIGLNGVEDPKLRYEYSAWNLALGIVFIELIAPPIIVLLDELKCPVGPK